MIQFPLLTLADRLRASVALKVGAALTMTDAIRQTRRMEVTIRCPDCGHVEKAPDITAFDCVQRIRNAPYCVQCAGDDVCVCVARHVVWRGRHLTGEIGRQMYLTLTGETT